MELLNQIEEYWTKRAEGYSQVNQGELATQQRADLAGKSERTSS